MPRAPNQRVLIWSLKAQPGGGGLCGLELARALNAQPGVTASVCCLADSAMERLAQSMHLTVHGLPPAFLQSRRAFAVLLDELRPTLVVNPMLSLRQTPLLPLVLRSTARYALMIHESRGRPGNSTLAERVGFVAQRWEGAHADLCVALSEHTAAQVAKDVSPSCLLTRVHPAFTAAVEKSPAAALATPPRILFFGRSNASKGLDRLLAAFAHLRKQIAVELDLCVSEATARDLGQREGVHCQTDFLSEQALEARIQAADVVALPYENATQSGVAARAMGVGCPCVATPVGGLPEQVLHERTGRVARDMTPEAFANALRSVLTDTTGYPALVQENLALAAGERSWRAFARALLEALP